MTQAHKPEMSNSLYIVDYFDLNWTRPVKLPFMSV